MQSKMGQLDWINWQLTQLDWMSDQLLASLGPNLSNYHIVSASLTIALCDIVLDVVAQVVCV